MKSKRALTGRTALLSIALTFALYALHRAERPAPGTAAVNTAAASIIPTLPARTTPAGDGGNVIPPTESKPVGPALRGTLGRGGTLISELDRLALPAGSVRERLLEALDGVLELRRLPPRTGITLSRDARGNPRLAVRAESDRFVRVSLDGSGGPPRVERVELPVVAEARTAGGTVTSSVSRTLEAAPWGRQLTLAFAEIFQWDVDLLTDPRPGDVVRIVYELRSLGPLPEDLPPFGDRVGRTGDPLGPGRILAASYRGAIASSTAFWVDGPGGRGGYYDDRGAPLRKTFLKSPLNYRRISSHFSRARRHPVTRRVVPHHGVDFAAASGTPVVAAADGRVVAAGWDGALGRAVRLRHGSDYVTVYGHLRGFARGLRNGSEVRQNEVIGYVGATGRATGPHLHYTLIERGRPVDPLTFDNPPVEPLPGSLLPRLERARLAWSEMLQIDPQAADWAAGPTPPGAARRPSGASSPG